MPEATEPRDPNYVPIDADAYREMQHALRDSPKGPDARFDGTPQEKAALAEQMRDLVDLAPAEGAQLLYIKRDDLLGLADDLDKAIPNFSPGQYAAAMATLIEP